MKPIFSPVGYHSIDCLLRQQIAYFGPSPSLTTDCFDFSIPDFIWPPGGLFVIFHLCTYAEMRNKKESNQR